MAGQARLSLLSPAFLRRKVLLMTQFSPSSFGLVPPRNQEIDLVQLLLMLWRRRKWLTGAVACGLGLAAVLGGLLTPLWTSEAIVVPPLFSELQAQEKVQERLAEMGVSVPLSSETWFGLFIQTYDAPVMQDAWLRQNATVRGPVHFSRDESNTRQRSAKGYRFETLTVTSSAPGLSRQLLAGYMRFVSQKVNQELSQRVDQTVNQWAARNKGEKSKTDAGGNALPLLKVQPYQIQERPTLPEQRSSLRPILLMLMGSLAGLMAGVAGILLYETWREVTAERCR